MRDDGFVLVDAGGPRAEDRPHSMCPQVRYRARSVSGGRVFPGFRMASFARVACSTISTMDAIGFSRSFMNHSMKTDKVPAM